VDLDSWGCGRSFKLRGITDGSGEGTRLFNSLRNTLYRHILPLLSREFPEEQGHWGDIETGVVIYESTRPCYSRFT